MHIDIEHGSEGPRHDPYAYTELTVYLSDGTTVMLHEGLGEYVKVNGKLIEIDMSTLSVAASRAAWAAWDLLLREKLHAQFAQLTGLTPPAAKRAYRKLRERCRNCGCRETRSMSGFPGETFDVCVRCEHIVDSHFNRSAIE